MITELGIPVILLTYTDLMCLCIHSKTLEVALLSTCLATVEIIFSRRHITSTEFSLWNIHCSMTVQFSKVRV